MASVPPWRAFTMAQCGSIALYALLLLLTSDVMGGPSLRGRGGGGGRTARPGGTAGTGVGRCGPRGRRRSAAPTRWSRAGPRAAGLARAGARWRRHGGVRPPAAWVRGRWRSPGNHPEGATHARTESLSRAQRHAHPGLGLEVPGREEGPTRSLAATPHGVVAVTGLAHLVVGLEAEEVSRHADEKGAAQLLLALLRRPALVLQRRAHGVDEVHHHVPAQRPGLPRRRWRAEGMLATLPHAVGRGEANEERAVGEHLHVRADGELVPTDSSAVPAQVHAALRHHASNARHVVTSCAMRRTADSPRTRVKREAMGAPMSAGPASSRCSTSGREGVSAP